MILRHGDYLYCLGGEDETGAMLSSVRAVRLDTEGRPQGAWFEVAALPGPVSNGMAFSLGHFVYVLGGITPDGELKDSILYAYANPGNGSLGFGDGQAWSAHGLPLPEGRARAAWAIHDGRLFLAGGLTPGGPSREILHAGISRDGYPGNWYRSREALPTPSIGAAAVVLLDDASGIARLIVAGGEQDDQPLAVGLSLAIGSYGYLSDPQPFLLPAPRYRPVLTTDGDGLLLAGGLGPTGSTGSSFHYLDGLWQDLDADGPALAGPGHARAGGCLLALPPDTGAQTLVTIDPSLHPEAPQVLPGSGIVPAGSYLRIQTEPGTVIRYRSSTDGPVDDVGSGDGIWQPGLRLQASIHFAFRAFHPDGRASPLVRRSYLVRSTGMFIHTERIYPQPASLAEPQLLVPGWYFFHLDKPSGLVLSWMDQAVEDAGTSGGTGSPGSSIISVFEPDLCTPVPDSPDGRALIDLASSASPARLVLSAGSYYIHIQSQEADAAAAVQLTLALDGDD